MTIYRALDINLAILTPHRDKKSLGVALVFAAIAHVMLLIYIKPPSSHRAWLPTVFDIQISHSKVRTIDTEPNNERISKSTYQHKNKQNINSASPQKAENIQRIDVHNPMAISKINENITENVTGIKTDKVPISKTFSPTASYTAFLESAQKLAKEDAKNLQKTKDDEVLLSDRAFAPKLAQVLAKNEKPVGTTKYADGMVKVVTSSGTEYCIQSESQLIKGAFDSEPIPMSCP